MLRHLPGRDPVDIDPSHRELPARGLEAEELAAMDAGMTPSHHDDIALCDGIVDGPAGIKCVEQVRDPLLESSKSRSLPGKGGMVQVILCDDPRPGPPGPAC